MAGSMSMSCLCPRDQVGNRCHIAACMLSDAMDDVEVDGNKHFFDVIDSHTGLISKFSMICSEDGLPSSEDEYEEEKEVIPKAKREDAHADLSKTINEPSLQAKVWTFRRSDAHLQDRKADESTATVHHNQYF